MKKLIFIAAVLAFAFAACNGNGGQAVDTAADTAVVVCDTLVPDTADAVIVADTIKDAE